MCAYLPTHITSLSLQVSIKHNQELKQLETYTRDTNNQTPVSPYSSSFIQSSIFNHAFLRCFLVRGSGPSCHLLHTSPSSNPVVLRLIVGHLLHGLRVCLQHLLVGHDSLPTGWAHAARLVVLRRVARLCPSSTDMLVWLMGLRHHLMWVQNAATAAVLDIACRVVDVIRVVQARLRGDL